MKLSQLLKNVEVKNEYKDVDAVQVTSDSRLVKEGYLFVCIKGAVFDGHSVAQKMLEIGAVAVVTDHDLGLDSQVIVENTRDAYSQICSNFFGNPAEKLRLIGLTGTNGKTTTTFLIKQILENVGKKVGLIGTVQNMVGDEVYPAHYTTPDPHELQSLFRKMVDANCEYCVMEVSSQALAQGRVSGIHFMLAAFTNLTQDHLDYHKTWENYFAAKRMLFENCDIALTNVDDENGLKIVEGLPCKVKTYGVKNIDSDFTARNVMFASDGVKYELVCDRIGTVKCPIPGRFSVYNSLCAASVALTLGFSLEEVIGAIAKSNGVKGRIEVVPTGTDYTVIIDYAHSPDGLENIISSLREIAKGRVVTLFGCGGDRDRTKRPKMGKIAAELSDFCVVTSDNPRSEDASAIIDDILEGMKDTKTPYKVVVNRKDAIRWAMENAQTDDIILLAGKGHETYQILPTGTIHFDEREVVRDILTDCPSEASN
ncbi:MAG: UDP-N-acetylmuramoyl-L-alanyl-D-glutamate--2,6-diaminopimelate ligase [Ruminococcaceae bacterium]|nr:UDP-N-acetylmuramoyl-L-alanyl-D-glutamate--2,6-diaminopimelate ligase [Oscillospiraceae bacterium]